MPNDFILIDAVQPFANLIARRTGLDNFSSARIVLASGTALGLLCLQRTLHFHDTEGSRVPLVVLVVALTVLMAWRCDMDARRAADERVSNEMPPIPCVRQSCWRASRCWSSFCQPAASTSRCTACIPATPR